MSIKQYLFAILFPIFICLISPNNKCQKCTMNESNKESLSTTRIPRGKYRHRGS